jgi:hypothetical protein
VAMQTIWPLIKHKKNQADSDVGDSEKRPMVLNTCHAWSTDTVVVKENAAKYYTGDE